MSGFTIENIDELYKFYMMQFDTEKIQTMILDQNLFDGLMRFFSIGILSKIEELIKKKKERDSLN